VYRLPSSPTVQPSLLNLAGGRTMQTPAVNLGVVE